MKFLAAFIALSTPAFAHPGHLAEQSGTRTGCARRDRGAFIVVVGIARLSRRRLAATQAND